MRLVCPGAYEQRKGAKLTNETLDVGYHTPYTDFELHAFVQERINKIAPPQESKSV